MSKQVHSAIIGTGMAVPDGVVTNFDLEKIVETSDEWITSRTGIRERRKLAPGQNSSDIGAEACRRALADANLTIKDVDMIIAATFSPDYVCPTTSCMIHKKLGATDIPAMDCNAACTGFLYGLQAADSMIRSGLYRRILVVGSEACTRFISYKNRDVCVLFGDGAGAVLLEATDKENFGILSTYLGADSSGYDLIMAPNSGSADGGLTPEGIAEAKHCLQIKGKEVFKFAVKILGTCMDETLRRANLTAADLDLLIPHQANIRIIDAAAERYGMPKDRVVANIDKYGNTSSASVPIALAEARTQGRVKPGMVVGLVAFGGGLTYGGAVVRF